MASARDLYLILRAQDRATAALNSFSRAVRKAGTDTLLAQLEARKGAEAAALSQNQLAQAGLRNEVAQLANENAMNRTQLAQARLVGTSQAYINAKKAEILSIEREIQIRRDQIIGNQDEAIAIRSTIQDLEREITARRNAISAIGEHQAKMQRFSETMKSASQMATTMGIGLAAVGVVGVIAIGSLVKASAEYDRQARLTSTQVAGMGEHLQEIKDIGLRVAHDIGVGFTEIQPALYDIFSSMNVGVAEGEKLLTQFAKAAVAGQTDIQSVSRGTIAIMNSMQLSVEDVTRILDVQFKFIQKGVGTYDEWATKIGLVAPSANRAGQSIETMMATLASASKMAGVAARAGTAVARSFDAFSNPAAVAKLKALGVAATDADGNFRPFVEVMFDFRAALDKVEGGQVGKMKVILDVFKGAGGTIEARRFLQQLLLVPGVLEDLNGIYKETQNASGSLDSAYATMAESVAVKTELLKNRFKELKIMLGDLLGPAFGKLLDIGNNVLDWFIKLDPHTQKMIVYFGLAVTAASLLFGALFLIVGAVAGVAAAFAVAGFSIGGVLLVVGLLTFGIGLLIGAFILIAVELKKAYEKSKDFRDAIDRVGESINSFVGIVKREWKEHVDPALHNTAKIVNEKLKPAWDDFWKTITEKVEPKVHDFIDWMNGNVEPVMKKIAEIIDKQLNPALESLAGWWKKNKDWLEPLLGMLLDLTKLLLQVWLIIAVIAGFTGFEVLIGAFASFVVWLGLIGWAIREVKKHWKEWWDDLVNASWEFTGIPGILDSVDKLKKAWHDFEDWWKKNTLFDTIKSALTDIQNTIQDSLTTILGMFGMSFGDMNSTTDTGMKGVKSKFKIGMDDVKQALTDGFFGAVGIVGAGIWDMLNRAGGISGVKKIFTDAFWDAVRGVESAIGAIMGAVGSIPGRILGALSGFSLFGVGASLGDGLASGIYSMIQPVAGAAAALGARAITAAREAVKSHSPSQEFMKIGHDVVDGFVIGLNRSTDKYMPDFQAKFSSIPAQIKVSSAPPALQTSKNVIFNLTVNQADRTARQFAQDLGQELAGMI